MKRSTTAALAIGTIFAIGALALPTLAQQAGHGHAAQDGETDHASGQSGGHGMMSPQMMQTMMRMHSGGGMGTGMMAGMIDGGMMDGGMMSPEMMRMMSQMHGGTGMNGMGMGGGTSMGGMGAGMMGQMAEGADANGNGVVSPEEMQMSLANRLATYDTDGDGTLSLAEFEAMHAAMIRPMMVDRFQALDEDGDGQVTSDEMTAMAGQMQRMMQMRAQLGGAHGHQGQAGGMMDGQGAGQMMTDN